MESTIVGKKNLEYFRPFLGDDPEAAEGVLGVVEDNMAIGAAAFEVRDRAAIMTRIFIDEDYRRRKAARCLLDTAKSAFLASGIRDFFVFYSENEELTAFLQNEGFLCTQSDPVYSCVTREAVSSENVKKLQEKLSREAVIACKNLITAEKEMVASLLKRHRFDQSVLEKDAYDENISFAYKSGDGIGGVLLARSEGEDVYVTALVTGRDDKKAAPELIGAFVRAVEEQKLTGGRLVFLARNRHFLHNIKNFLDSETQLEPESSTWSAFLHVEETEDDEDDFYVAYTSYAS